MFKKFRKPFLFKAAALELAIERLADDDVRIGTAFHEISHADVIQYIEKRKCHILGRVPRPQGDWVEFYAYIEKKIFLVRLDVARDGLGSVLTSLRLDLRSEISRLFRDEASEIMYGLRLPFTDESYKKEFEFGIEERLEEDMHLAARLVQKFFEKNPLFFYPVLGACDGFHGGREVDVGLLSLLCHEGTGEEKEARLQCLIAVEALMRNNNLPCFRTVNLKRLSEELDRELSKTRG